MQTRRFADYLKDSGKVGVHRAFGKLGRTVTWDLEETMHVRNCISLSLSLSHSLRDTGSTLQKANCSVESYYSCYINNNNKNK